MFSLARARVTLLTTAKRPYFAKFVKGVARSGPGRGPWPYKRLVEPILPFLPDFAHAHHALSIIVSVTLKASARAPSLSFDRTQLCTKNLELLNPETYAKTCTKEARPIEHLYNMNYI